MNKQIFILLIACLAVTCQSLSKKEERTENITLSSEADTICSKTKDISMQIYDFLQKKNIQANTICLSQQSDLLYEVICDNGLYLVSIDTIHQRMVTFLDVQDIGEMADCIEYTDSDWIEWHQHGNYRMTSTTSFVVTTEEMKCYRKERSMEICDTIYLLNRTKKYKLQDFAILFISEDSSIQINRELLK